MKYEIAGPGAERMLDRRQLHALGVLIPIDLHPLAFLPGRHPLGRAGDGLRFLRTREFDSREDNPRDVDRFSLPGAPWINEWEAESRASIRLLADLSGSMAHSSKAAVQRRLVLQLTYSLWRAGDRLTVNFFGERIYSEVRERNLPAQLQALWRQLLATPKLGGTDILRVLQACAESRRGPGDDLVFLSSDFLSLTARESPVAAQEWRSTLRQWGYSLVPVVITFELPEEISGLAKMWDPERGRQRLTLFSPARVRRINQEERARVARLVGLFRSTGLDHIVLHTERDVYTQLVTLARRRRQRTRP
jgi:uncharacterized protein (DUF58 family)